MNDDHHDDADLSRGHPRISASQTLLWFQQPNKRLPGLKGASVPAEPIRVIVVIVVNPRQVFAFSVGQDFGHVR
jgi:hypothetical protein